MEGFLGFFESLGILEKVLWVGFAISFNLILETLLPLSGKAYKKWLHGGVNLLFLLPIFLINFLLGYVTVQVYGVISGSEWVLISLVQLPVWAELILAIAIFDLVGQYLVHFLLHKIKWMWKLHMVHHSDTHLDVTSALRLHPGDYLVREIAALLVIAVTGVPVSYYLVYRFSTIFFTYFTHANIRLPYKIDKVLSWVFVTPNMHKFHHHFERPWTNTNYGNILSVWDRLFGTFVYDDPQRIKYGLDVLDDSTSNDFTYQMKLPFDRSVKTDY